MHSCRSTVIVTQQQELTIASGEYKYTVCKKRLTFKPLPEVVNLAHANYKDDSIRPRIHDFFFTN